jgi:hypothetical protein
VAISPSPVLGCSLLGCVPAFFKFEFSSELDLLSKVVKLRAGRNILSSLSHSHIFGFLRLFLFVSVRTCRRGRGRRALLLRVPFPTSQRLLSAGL